MIRKPPPLTSFDLGVADLCRECRPLVTAENEDFGTAGRL
jgi:hypothetical protein